MLFRPIHGGLIPKKQLEERCALFAQGDWLVLLEGEGVVVSSRGHTRGESGNVKRVNRALQLVQMGELSAARHVLEGAGLAPGTLATLHALTDAEKRPL